jgi:peptidoglycan/xylan/chitin deacetylase (PgdA/CDA1 family)
VLTVLLGAQVHGAWQRRPAFDDTALSSAHLPQATPAPTRPSPTATPVPTNPPRTAPPVAPPRVKPTKRTSGAARLAAMGVKRITGTRAVALTFDDGPHPAYTPQILGILRANGVRAVFCLVGSEVRRYPHLVRQIAREGHTLCNHTWGHELTLGKRSTAEIKASLARTNAEIRRVVPGARVPYFRQPGGEWTAKGVRVARELGMTSLGWTVDPRDWEKPSATLIKSRVLGSIKAGGVVLLHDAGGDRSATVSACRSMIPTLVKRHRLTLLR